MSEIYVDEEIKAMGQGEYEPPDEKLAIEFEGSGIDPETLTEKEGVK